MEDSSLYLISNDYVPLLIKKSLFKNPEKAIKIINSVKIPIYYLDNFEETKITKSPNAFILFRCEVFESVKTKNPNSSSRAISKIIGNLWRNSSEETKALYRLKAYQNKNDNNYKYKKILRNLKSRRYIKRKESISLIKTILKDLAKFNC